MIHEEFKNLKTEIDANNPFSTLYILDDCRFYVEPAFFTQLHGFKERHTPSDYQKIINEMIRLVRKNKRVVFTANFECPQTDASEFIYLEITDVTDPLKIFVEDKSRGSDYGD